MSARFVGVYPSYMVIQIKAVRKDGKISRAELRKNSLSIRRISFLSLIWGNYATLTDSRLREMQLLDQNEITARYK